MSQDNVAQSIQYYRWRFGSEERGIMTSFDFSQMPVKDERYRLESNRLQTFKNFPDHLKRLVVPLSQSGFYYVNGNGDGTEEVEGGQVRVNDTVECIFCGITLQDWARTHRVNQRHKYASCTCPFMLNVNVGNVSITDQYFDSSTRLPTSEDERKTFQPWEKKRPENGAVGQDAVVDEIETIMGSNRIQNLVKQFGNDELMNAIHFLIELKLTSTGSDYGSTYELLKDLQNMIRMSKIKDEKNWSNGFLLDGRSLEMWMDCPLSLSFSGIGKCSVELKEPNFCWKRD